MKARLRGQMRLFTESELEPLLQQALRVLREVPFRVQGTDEFFDYLTDYGCQIDGELVRFPDAVIDKVLARYQDEKRKDVERRERDGARRDDWPRSEITVFTHGQALHICDVETNGLRNATEADLAKWCHMVDALGIESRAHPTFIPTDVPVEAADFHAFATIILNSRRPHGVSVYGAKMLPFFIEACKVVNGPLDAASRAPVFHAKAWVTSPFMLDRENLEIGMDARRLLGQPLTFGHMPVAGASTPISVAGALVQNTAEALALSAMRLAVDDLPQPVAGSQAVMDMRAGFPRQTGPDMILHRLAGYEMNDYLYKAEIDPPAFGWLGVGAATVSPQSLLEKALGAGFAVAMGARHLGVGCLAFSDVGSPVQLMLDMELVTFFQGLFRDVAIDDGHVGLETILETAPTGGRFLEVEHTARLFREECWLPDLMDFRSFTAWAQNPCDLIRRATKKAVELRDSSANQCPLSEQQIAQIKELMKEADAAVSNGRSE